MNTRFYLQGIGTVALVGLTACSGHGATETANPVAIAQTQRSVVPVSFIIAIPRPSGITPKYISISTLSASIVLNGGAPTLVNCTTVCSATLDAPVGNDTFAVKLYDAPLATGNVLSQGSTTAQIIQNAANKISVTFDGVLASLTITSTGPAVTRGIASSVGLSIVGKDADGNIVIGSYSTPVTLTNSDPSGATTINTTSIASSSTTATVAYNGANSYSGSSISANVGGISAPAAAIIANPCATMGTMNNGYYPCDLAFAYNLPTRTAGTGQTVAIIDAYDDPLAEADLAVYRAKFGLPDCTTANGCFKKVDQNGGTNYPQADSNWAGEISLDIDMVSAVCPNCHILLVEANQPFIQSLGTALNTAVALGATEVSNSYGGPEFSGETSYDAAYFNHPGIPITVSTGDNGYGVQYPSSSGLVTAVGGTKLTPTTNTRGWTETVWSNKPTQGTGSGCSPYEAKPSWQVDSGCPGRIVADVSAVADPNSGVYVYDSYPTGGWQVYGGTSASAPIIAAVYALAGNASATNYGSYPYLHASALNDIVSGSNGTCSVAYFCSAGTGYDGPTGLGSPNGTGGLGAFIQPASWTGARMGSVRTFTAGPIARVCAPATKPGDVSCDALIRTDLGRTGFRLY